MAKSKTFIRNIELPVLFRNVLVMCGDLEEVARRFKNPDEWSGYEVSKTFLARAWRDVKANIDEALEEHPHLQGVTFADSGDVYMWLPVWKGRVVLHELYHAVQRVQELTGVKDEEYCAFLIEYLADRVFCIDDGDRTCGRRK